MKEDEKRIIETAMQRAFNPESVARKQVNQIVKILQSFSKGVHNTGNMLEQILFQQISEKQPIQIVGFWGVGEKKKPDDLDIALLDNYSIIKKLVEALTSNSVEVDLILADIHGNFNGYEDFETYLANIYLESRGRGINPIFLRRLYEEWKINIEDVYKNSDENLLSQFQNMRQSVQLIDSARKHSKRGLEPQNAAFYYWLMRRQEAEPLVRTFPKGILFVNGSKDLARVTLPQNMPHVYSRFGPVWFQ